MHKLLTSVALAAVLAFSAAPVFAGQLTINGKITGGLTSFTSNGDFGSIGSAKGYNGWSDSTSGYQSGGSSTGSVNTSGNGSGSLGTNVWAYGSSGNTSYAYGPGNVSTSSESGGALSGGVGIVGGSVSGHFNGNL